MYKDIISYELAENITEEHLLNVAKNVVDTWMKKQPGFIKWEINSNIDSDIYTDIVFWETREAAKNAEKEMGNIPNAEGWFACYKEGSMSSKNVSFIAEF